MSDTTDPVRSFQALAHIATAMADVAKKTGVEEPEPVRSARRQLEHTRHRLIEIASELRGVDCDFDTIARSRDDHPAIAHAAGFMATDEHDMREALDAVVDMTIYVEHCIVRLDEWKPEPEGGAE